MIKLTPKQKSKISMLKRQRDRALAAASTPSIRASLAMNYSVWIGRASPWCSDCDRGAPVGYYRCNRCQNANQKEIERVHRQKFPLNEHHSEAADLLTTSPTNWSRFVALGGDIETVIREASAHGDQELARKGRRALERRR